MRNDTRPFLSEPVTVDHSLSHITLPKMCFKISVAAVTPVWSSPVACGGAVQVKTDRSAWGFQLSILF
jgi:hypothetical protein